MDAPYQSDMNSKQPECNQQMAPQPMMMMAPGQMSTGQLMTPGMMENNQMIYKPVVGGGCFVADPLNELNTIQKVYVIQKFELLETVTGCETPNQYYVFAKDQEGNKKYLFKAKEHSNWCCRNCCPGSARSFSLDLKRVTQTAQGYEKKVDFAKFERPWRCTFCCFCRPEMTGKFEGEKTGFLGKVVEPCTVCDPLIRIINSENVIAYTITCNCCQCGYRCRSSCFGRCSEVDFSIHKGSTLSEKAVGNVYKSFKDVKV